MEYKSADKLTQLDELCLSCLTMKYAHVEHCNKCNQCVKDFQKHCKLFNTCVGEGNAKSYVIFLLLNTLFAAVLAFVTFTDNKYWKNPASTNFIFRVLETHFLGLF